MHFDPKGTLSEQATLKYSAQPDSLCPVQSVQSRHEPALLSIAHSAHTKRSPYVGDLLVKCNFASGALVLSQKFSSYFVWVFLVSTEVVLCALLPL